MSAWEEEEFLCHRFTSTVLLNTQTSVLKELSAVWLKCILLLYLVPIS